VIESLIRERSTRQQVFASLDATLGAVKRLPSLGELGFADLLRAQGFAIFRQRVADDLHISASP